MRKTKIIFAAFILLGLSTYGQQLPQFSQYMQNMYVLNPAASSLYEDVDINVGFRQQWAGFDGAPLTYYASGTVNLGKKDEPSGYLYSIPISRRDLLKSGTSTTRYAKHVVGGLVAQDEYGLFKRTSIMASYSYHHPIGEDYYLSVGTSLGWYGLNFGSDEVILENPTDNTYNDFIANGNQSNLFDINAGVFLYSDRAFLGYSIYQLGQNEINLGNEESPINFSQAKLRMHHFATVGYAIPVSERIDLTPSLMFKVLGSAPVSYDINLRAEYDEKFWVGVSYRNEDAISALLGLRINDWMQFGYSIDFVTSEINNLASGSHEIVMGFQFNRKRSN
jgi:type IX secretion system PorP/SprF family membrane protein